MAYIKSLSTVLDKMKEKEIICFSILDSTGKVLHENNNDDVDPSMSRDSLESFIDDLEGTVQIILRPGKKIAQGKGGDIRGNLIYFFRCGLKSQINGLEGNTSVFGLMKQMFDEKTDKLKSDLEHEREIEKLRNEYEEKQDTAILQIWNEIKPFMPMILSKFPTAQMPVPVSGVATDVIEEKINADQIRIVNDCVGKLYLVDPDFTNTIQLLADLATLTPDAYKSFIPMLKMQVDNIKSQVKK